MLSIPTTTAQPEDLDTLQPDELSVDWVRLVFPVGMEDDVRDIAVTFSGAVDREEAPALHRRMCGERFANGVRLSYTPLEAQVQALMQDKGIGPVLEVPGTALQRFDLGECLQLLQTCVLDFGARASRLDLAADYLNGSQRDLIHQATSAAIHGDLCRAKAFHPITTYTGTEITGHGLNLGRRGKNGSGRFVRIYDKGLETQTAPIGEWVRWEAEFTGDVARRTLEALVHPDDPADPLGLCLGAVEFREKSDRAGDRNVTRRPFTPFYKRLLVDGDPYRFSACRKPQTASSRIRWARQMFGKPIASVLKARPRANVLEVLEAMFGAGLGELAAGRPKGSALDLLVRLDTLRGRPALAAADQIGGRF